ncbi:hypothetical protein GW17_00009727 [Ensete ventricosum]|nr:hypothetical protein GW17_00009727 [Ensete ventricosum]
MVCGTHRGDASSPSRNRRRRLVFQRENEALPCLNISRYGQYSMKRRRIVFQRENEALPRPRAGRQDNASSPCRKRRRRLVFQRANEVLPHPRAGRRGNASPSSTSGKTRRRITLPRRKTRRRLVSPADRIPVTWRTDTYRPYRAVQIEIANLA